MRWRRGRHCRSRMGHVKKRWATLKAAEFVAEWCTMKDGQPRRAYYCETCDGWHTTSTGATVQM